MGRPPSLPRSAVVLRCRGLDSLDDATQFSQDFVDLPTHEWLGRVGDECFDATKPSQVRSLSSSHRARLILMAFAVTAVACELPVASSAYIVAACEPPVK